MEFTKSKFSIEELEQFRNSEGYIDLDEAGLILEDESREKRGNTERFKNWIDFSGSKVLIKEENMLEGKRNFGVYSELIMEELAKQMGLPAAKYDLIKYQGKYGILSHMINDPEKEELETVYGLIGETTTNPENPDICDYIEVEQKFKKSLKSLQMTPEEIKQVINDRRKQKILQLFCCEADGHIENEGIIRYKAEDGRTVAKIAPMFDNETSFLLDLDEAVLETINFNNNEDNEYRRQLEIFQAQKKSGKSTEELVESNDTLRLTIYNLRNLNVDVQKMAEILEGDASIREAVKPIRSKIAYIPEEDEKEDFPYDCIPDNTLTLMREIGEDEPEIDEFLAKIYEELDIEDAIAKVEEKIKAPVPKIVKDTVIPFVRMRKKALNDILCYQEPCAEKTEQAETLYESLIIKKEKENELPFNIGELYSKQIAEKSVEEGISLKEGLGLLDTLSQISKSFEKSELDKKKDETTI